MATTREEVSGTGLLEGLGLLDATTLAVGDHSLPDDDRGRNPAGGQYVYGLRNGNDS
jgi:hypothetical protein